MTRAPCVHRSNLSLLLERLRDLYGQGVAAEGRSDLDALDEVADFEQGLLRNPYAFRTCLLPGVSPVHSIHDRRGD